MNFYKNTLKLDYLSSIDVYDRNYLTNILSLLKDRASSTYFWRNLNNKNLFPFLYSNKFFEILSTNSKDDVDLFQNQIFISDYLLRIADYYPSKVTEIIKSTCSDNNRVIWNFAEIGLKIPAKYTAKLIPKITIWTKADYLSSTNFAHDIIKWFDHLTSAQQYEAALKLLKELTLPIRENPNVPAKKELKKYFGKTRPKAMPVLDYYYFQIMLKKCIENLSKFRPLETIKILTVSLEKAINIEYGYLKGSSDLSYIWRPAIEDHSQNYDNYELKDTLLVALRTNMENFIQENKDSALDLIIYYWKHKLSIFRRLALHLLRINFNQYSSFIHEIVSNPGLLQETDISHEYYILLRDNFSKFDKNEQGFIIESIKSFQYYDPQEETKIQEAQKRYYWLEKLHLFEKYLNESDKKFYDQLKKEFQGETLHETNTWHESYYGEKSPLSVDELETLKIFDIWTYFKTFKKNNGSFNAPSPEGLARIFGEVIKRNPERFLQEDLTPLIDLLPNYSYWVLNPIVDLFKSGKFLDNPVCINNVLKLCSRLMRLNDIPRRFTDDMGINFTSVRKQILEVIQALIKTHQKDFSINYKDQIWDIIEYLCFLEYSRLPNWEKDDNQTDPVTKSLNTVKGTAMHTLVDYALWYAFHSKQSHLSETYANRFAGEERIQYLLEDMLNKKNEPSLTVHSVYGLFLPNLAYLNIAWLKENLHLIFPNQEINKEYWKAAWNAYICYSRFYKDIYKLLRPQFKRALNYVSRNELIIPSSPGRSSEDSLAEHLIIACINGLDDVRKSDSLMRIFAKISGNKNMTYAVQFISNIARNERIFHSKDEFWEQAKAIWEIRIRTVKKELRTEKNLCDEDGYSMEFGRYYDWLKHLPPKVDIREINSLLKETIKINKKGWHLPELIDYLESQSSNYPIEAIYLLKQLIQTEAPHNFFLGKESGIKIILNNAIKYDREIKPTAEWIINSFGEWGNYFLKEFWMENFLSSMFLVKLTKDDIKHCCIRINENSMKYFPTKKAKSLQGINLKIIIDNQDYDVCYHIRSGNNEIRNGYLVFQKDDYRKLKYYEGENIGIIVLIKNKYYKVTKNITG